MTVDEKVDQFEEMWKKVEEKLGEIYPSRPKDSFTSAEFAKHKKMHVANAVKIINKMIAAGSVKRVGKGRKTFYVLLEKR